MTCSRCGAALQNQTQFDRGLCASCLTGSSLSALVGLAASHQPDLIPGDVLTFEGVDSPITFQPPVYFGIPRADFEGLPAEWPPDTAWKRAPGDTPTPAARDAAISAHQPLTDAWGNQWVPVPNPRFK